MKKISNWFNKPKLSIMFYILSIIGFCYSLYAFIVAYQYIDGLVIEGKIVWIDNIGDIIQYMATNVGTHIFYSFAFLFFGYCCAFINPRITKEVVEENGDVNDEESLEEEIVNNQEEVQK